MGNPTEYVRVHNLWYVVQNDLIGGYSISLQNFPTSHPQCVEIATFVSKETAEHVATLHNDWLAGRRV